MKKKYVLIKLAAVIGISAAFLSSCQQKESPVTPRYDINVKVNPSAVASYPYEMNTGDLTKVETGYKIRVSLRIYDTSGFLVDKKTDYLQNYDAIGKFAFSLPSGTYTFLATTDIVKYDGSNVTFEYWNIGNGKDSTDDQKLSELQIVDNGKIGFSGAKILGVTSQRIVVTDSATDANINVMPAGALALVVFNNIHTYSNVKSLEVETSKLGDYLYFDNSGNSSVSFKWPEDGYYFRIDVINVEDYSKYSMIYSYVYILPGDKYELKARYSNTEGKSGYLVNNTEIVSFKGGDEYLIWVDCKDEDTGEPLFSVDKFTNTKSLLNISPDNICSSGYNCPILKNVQE